MYLTRAAQHVPWEDSVLGGHTGVRKPENQCWLSGCYRVGMYVGSVLHAEHLPVAMCVIPCVL